MIIRAAHNNYDVPVMWSEIIKRDDFSNVDDDANARSVNQRCRLYDRFLAGSTGGRPPSADHRPRFSCSSCRRADVEHPVTPCALPGESCSDARSNSASSATDIYEFRSCSAMLRENAFLANCSRVTDRITIRVYHKLLQPDDLRS